jgi:fluoroacetyl-CoA thioesterase
MKDTLKPGVKTSFSYKVPREKTVPFLFEGAGEMADMPEVFATGFMIGLMEWTCMKALAGHLDEGEGSVGVHVDVSHDAATPAGMTVTVDAEVTEVDGRKVWFAVRAHDGVHQIGEGYHQRAIVDWEKFNKRNADKTSKAVG